MKRILALLLFLCVAMWAAANDGSFTVSGNQLIPIVETDIRVQKEILSLNRNGNQIIVSVYYEFFNPVGPKDLLVGFEASGPYMFSLEDALKAFPEHPNMRGFNVIMNGTPLSWQVAHINSFGHVDNNGQWVKDPYYKNGKMVNMSDRQCKEALRNSEEAFDYPFQFVYYFTAHFENGLNIIEHTYSYDVSGSGGAAWQFSYVLTAACRWANRGIDDFTLHVNMGDRASFCIDPSFYNSYREWTFDGAGRVEPNYSDEAFFMGSYDLFHVRDGGITFHKTKFRPKGELYVFEPATFLFWNESWLLSDDYIKDFIGVCYYDLGKPSDLREPITLDNRQILRNLPFAYRGYVFKKASLQRIFEATPWYVPDPSYKADMGTLTKGEKEWVMFWAKGGKVDAVDMGLSVKWASCNVGASSPEDYGDYFAWGETEPYYSSLNPLVFKPGYERGYDRFSYLWYMGGENSKPTKYSTHSWYSRNGKPDNKTVLEPADDAARANFGGSWRMPTEIEWLELKNNCSWEWTSRNGVNGCLVTSPKTGNSIFLPAGGNMGSQLYSVGREGYYWASTLCSSDESSADGIEFDSGGILSTAYGRPSGQSVRAVTD